MIRAFRRLSRLWRTLTVLLLVVTLLIGYVTVTFVQVWADSRRDGAAPADAIVVLGAAQYDGRPSPVLEQRLDHALELHHAGLAPLIVVTGGRREGDRFTEATAGYNYLRARGIPDAAIRKEVQGTSTYESLAAVSRFLHDEGIDDVILVSGRAPSKRMKHIAREVGLDARISPAGGSAPFDVLVKESLGVSLGRLIGFRRLDGLDN